MSYYGNAGGDRYGGGGNRRYDRGDRYGGGGDRYGGGDRRHGGGGGGGGGASYRGGSGRNWRDKELGNSRGGAEHLARIHGTEEDKVNCPFYFKIGACRHGDRCARQHHKPPFSQTILIKHMYRNPASNTMTAPVPGQRAQPQGAADPLSKEATEEFEDFFEEVYEELGKFGDIDEIHVCDNLGDHMVGNVYAKFHDEEDADEALKGLNGRFYAGQQLLVEFSPVTDFREARCRQYDEGQCTYGPYCNFLHVKRVGRGLRRELEKRAKDKKRQKERSASRSRSRSRSRGRRDSPSKSRSPDTRDHKEENGNE